MLREAMSRRGLFKAGAVGLAATAIMPEAASADALTDEASTNEEIVRRWYKLWVTEKNDWAPFDAMLANNWTFTSPVDDHISKSAFKKNCWDTQITLIDKVDLELVTVKGNEALVKYLGHTKNGKSFRNVEYLRLSNQKFEALECYFGGNLNYPSAVSARQG
jgi:ketosteroid isomerase-like protein